MASCTWDGSWPPPGVRALRAASHDARVAVLRAWAVHSTSRRSAKAWELAYWTGKPADVEKVAVDPESEWWRGVAVLLTWQGDWGLVQPTIELPLVDEGGGERLQRLLPPPARGEDGARAVDAEAEALRAHPRVRMVWEALQKFQTHVAERFVLDGVAVSLEIYLSRDVYGKPRCSHPCAHVYLPCQAVPH